jgi:hypothetical protein
MRRVRIWLCNFHNTSRAPARGNVGSGRGWVHVIIGGCGLPVSPSFSIYSSPVFQLVTAAVKALIRRVVVPITTIEEGAGGAGRR